MQKNITQFSYSIRAIVNRELLLILGHQLTQLQQSLRFDEGFCSILKKNTINTSYHKKKLIKPPPPQQQHLIIVEIIINNNNFMY